MKIKLRAFGNITNSTMRENHDSMFSGMKIGLAKRKINIIPEIESMINRKCSCGNKQSQSMWKGVRFVKAADGIYDVDFGTYYCTKDKSYGDYYACGKEGCFLKKLNSNSKEFIKHAYKTNLEEASNLLLSRNKSPFYRTNHKTQEDYDRFQGRADVPYEIKKNYYKTQNDSYHRNKNNFIKEHGIDVWEKEQKQKRNRHNFLDWIEKADGDEKKALIDYNNYIDSTRYMKKSEIDFNDVESIMRYCRAYSYPSNTEQEFYEYLTDNFNDLPLITRSLKLSRIEKYAITKEERLIEKVSFGFYIFKILFKVENLLEYFNIPKKVEVFTKYVLDNNWNSTRYSYSISEDGFYFRSGMEYATYIDILDIKEVCIIDINKGYPKIDDNRFLYDFLIEYNKERYYIELCPTNSEKEYVDNVKNKQSIYNNVILVYDINKFLRDLRNNKCIKEGDYFND